MQEGRHRLLREGIRGHRHHAGREMSLHQVVDRRDGVPHLLRAAEDAVDLAVPPQSVLGGRQAPLEAVEHVRPLLREKSTLVNDG